MDDAYRMHFCVLTVFHARNFACALRPYTHPCTRMGESMDDMCMDDAYMSTCMAVWMVMWMEVYVNQATYTLYALYYFLLWYSDEVLPNLGMQIHTLARNFATMN